MSVESEIIRLQGVKSEILSSIAAKNVIVPPGAALADCPGLIASINDINCVVYPKRITSVSGIYVVDTKGYIGIKVNDYFSQNGSPYPGNYALVVKGPSYQNLGLGQVTFLDEIVGSVTIGDKTYRTVVMPDGKEWMAENLDFLPDDGSIAKNPLGLPSTAAAWYYNRDEATYGWEGKKYGLLYNWYAAKALTIAGWHLPSTTEWDALATACGGSSSCGTKLKSTTGWKTGNGTDNWGFTAFPAGYLRS